MPFSANRAHGDRGWRRVRHQPCVYGVGNSGAKKPQLLQQQTDVVAGAAHRGVQGISEGEALLSGINLVALGFKCTEHLASSHAMHVVLSR